MVLGSKVTCILIYRPVERIKQIFQEKELAHKGLTLASEEPVVALAVAVYQSPHILIQNRADDDLLAFYLYFFKKINFVKRDLTQQIHFLKLIFLLYPANYLYRLFTSF